MSHKFKYYLSSIPASTYILSLVLLALIGFIVFGSFRYKDLNTNLLATQNELASTTKALEEKTQHLLVAKTENSELYTKLTGETLRNDSFFQQIQSLSSTVGILDKLSKTDEELLQKYSKVYFLNEYFLPSSLAPIETTFLLRKDKPETIHSNVKPYLENMIKTAEAEGVNLLVLSGYRSFNTQANLKANYKIVYGSGANQFSADQGYSEHQLGSTVDFTNSTAGELLNSFDKTQGYEWLTKNAHRFGFILSYPKNNTFYQYEPWHWRFVGVELATKLRNENKFFYDLDQREINQYLIKIFD
ncbi:MAG: M15 family metallopeptidase [Patescibacteria group bacterium]